MALITWNEKMSVGVAELDRHHQRLIALINSLHDAMTTGKGRDIIGSILEELVKYTVYHFGAEEKLMTLHKYVGYVSHKAEHEKFVLKASDLLAQHKSGNIAVTIPVMQFLRDWLNGHIMGTDKKYGPFFNSKGVN